MNDQLQRELKTLDRSYSYEQTVQLGRYRLDSEDEDKPDDEEAKPKQKKLSKSVRFHEHDPREDWKEERKEKTCLGQLQKMCFQMRPTLSWISIRSTLVDWLLLAILGIGMAIASMIVDAIIDYLNKFQIVLLTLSGSFESESTNYLLTYLSWVGYTEILVLCSAMFVHYIAPQAIGSGIPEMKTILRGVILKDYLSFKTLVSKFIGLTFSLGSGVPIGKVGPFVHLASIAANLLSNLAAGFDGAYGNECRKSEMLAAACAVGVACCFSAPVGGVLFSIEVTTMYFSVRNYWRGFFAAACGATVFRLLRVVLLHSEATLVAFYQTDFPKDAFEYEELPFFALIGVICGFVAATYIIFYRSLVMFLRQNDYAKKFFQKNWIVYPIVVSFFVASITYPRGYGRFLTGRYKFTQTIVDLFSNCTFTKPVKSLESPHGCSLEQLSTWTNHEGYGPYNFFVVVTLFAFTFLFLSGLCNTMPIPCGMFMPTFVVGAAIGRGVGEFVSVLYPDGMPGGTDQPIFPGVYAVVGAAALSGAVSHSVSVAMICCEMTGQLVYIIPLMVAVIVANAVCKHLQPSIYDAVINIKHLPYLPDIPPSNSAVHFFTAEHIMVTPVRYLTKKTTYMDIRNIVVEMRKVHSFPVVDDHEYMMLLGSIAKRRLLEILNKQIGDEARKQEAERRIKVAIETIDQHFKDNMALRFLQVLDADSKKTSFVVDIQDNYHNGDFNEQDIEMVEEVLESKLADQAKKVVEQEEEEFPRRQSFTRSRFTIEPVTAEEENQPKSKKIRYFSGGNGKTHPPPRVRRNAFSSASIHSDSKEYENDDRYLDKPEETKSVASEVSDTSKKHSWHSKIGYDTVTKNLANFLRNAKNHFNLQKRKGVKEKAEYDLFEDERREWEMQQLNEAIEIDEVLIDPAPFQLVRRTSLYKVHSVFSLLSLNRAYVTDRGRLVGVVALKDVRIAIQNAQSGVPLNAQTDTNTSTTNTTHDMAETDVEKGLPEDGSQYGSQYNTVEPHPEVAQNFMEQIERHRLKLEQRNNSEVHDLLTPPLKIVHPSQADLQRFYNHPMLTIHEENEPVNWSRKSSLKSQTSDREERPRVEFHTNPSDVNVSAMSQPASRRESTILEELVGETSELAGPVAEAVAYIQAKEVTIEDLRTLGEEIEEEKHEQDEAEPTAQ
ncbi:unnamed protein product [Bursaphelenchus okinawaensis]|uniref:Chloride channel protein n=1 Tax=Bursaphelenchus okinawaensis TaxID=465554 RepID=A0A811LJJ2_9BILA|nr:unnamed protein product [Bursaphelenchus okinawaensis]CAG9124817.1 unnamed protein product [Bursaphelenchus okinawaensis]